MQGSRYLPFRVIALVAGAVVGAACFPSAAETQDVAIRPGIEILVTDSLHLVKGRRVALVSNMAAIASDGTPGVELLLNAGVKLVALMSPEHGYRGAAEAGEGVESGRDGATGLPIYSLYGRATAPTDSMLQDLDLILIDLPDVGSRYYTYISTTVEVMRAAARRAIPVAILDRPNPVGGKVAGNVLNPAYRSFVGMLSVPMRHGMTLAEQALLAVTELDIPVDLVVIPVSGWRRELTQLDTGVPFRRPSPNLKDLESLFHYPGTCLFEGTALSVGRGTDFPFHQIGAPWLDTAAVLKAMRALALPGVRFQGGSFVPESPGDGKFAGVPVQGIRLIMTDPKTYDPVRTAIELLVAVRAVHPTRIGFNAGHFDRLAGGSSVREAILGGATADQIMGDWKAGLAGFEERARLVRLYP